MFGRATITLGIGPHSSSLTITVRQSHLGIPEFPVVYVYGPHRVECKSQISAGFMKS